MTSATYRLCEQLSITEVDDEVVLLNLDTGMYYGLNHVGALFVKGLQNERSMQTIILDVVDQYQTNYETVCEDMDALVKQLLEQGLIEEVSDS